MISRCKHRKKLKVTHGGGDLGVWRKSLFRKGEDSRGCGDLTTLFLSKINAFVELVGLIPGSYQCSKDIYANDFCTSVVSWILGLETLAFFYSERHTMPGSLGSAILSSLIHYYHNTSGHWFRTD